MTALHNRAILVSLNISEWTARKYDKAASRGVTARAGAVDNAARVNKALLPAAASLEAVHKKTNDIRTAYYKRALPWRDGTQIISTRSYVEFVQWFNAEKAERDRLVDAFVADYPHLKRDAELALNNLYNEADYPPASEIRGRFSCAVSFEPMPNAADWRVDVADEHMARMKADLEKSVEARVGAAMQDAWRRIYEVVERAKDRLGQPDAIFRNSLVENAVELCALLPSLNITGDPALEETRQALERSLAAADPQRLRDNPTERKDMARQMDAIMAKMGPLYQQAA